MIEHETLLVTLVNLVEPIPVPPAPRLAGVGAHRPIPTGCFCRRW